MKTTKPSQQKAAAEKRWKGHRPGKLKSFRLTERSLEKIKLWAKANGGNATAALEKIIAAAPESPPSA